MKALLLSKYRHLEITEIPAPTPVPGEVLVRVAACGICGGDVHGYDGSPGRRIPPIVMGHEASGRVAAVGDGVTSFSAGDRVTSTPKRPGQPQDLDAAVVFLAAESSRYVTG